ncbi:hypothetical protein ZOSMA_93G00420 [Zostera marina]|uniref:BHLH domain-containing protein n=1 Tax=Zostera marina TaxID=29655 RepID=A0A0K9NIX7_ZOSMR|nr:hypothetical protein ZOSMA_93G00420 [Zostera marina]
MDKSCSRCPRQKRRILQQKRKKKINTPIQAKLRELQTLIPGGEGLMADELFTLTANYISKLKLQVLLLHTFSNMCMP